MSDPQAKQTPITDTLLQMAGATKIITEYGPHENGQVGPELMKNAADLILGLKDAARRVTEAVSAGGITSDDAPSDAALAALRDLAG